MSQGINFLVFTGIDTSICVETSLREGFTLGYDVAMISNATGSGESLAHCISVECIHNIERLSSVFSPTSIMTLRPHTPSIEIGAERSRITDSIFSPSECEFLPSRYNAISLRYPRILDLQLTTEPLGIRN